MPVSPLSDPTWGPFFGPLLGLGLFAATLSDLRRRRVPNWLNGSVAATGLAYQATRAGFNGLLYAGLGMATGFALVLIPFALRLHRGGDAKLVIALGAWLLPLTTVWAYIWGVALGGLVAVGVLIVAKRDERRAIARNLRLAAATATLPQVEAGRPGRLQVPMALAFSAGAVVATLWEL